jgi:hypothetical protein
MDLTAHLSYYNGFKRSEYSKQVTAGKRKHITVTVSQKLEIIRRLESGEN